MEIVKCKIVKYKLVKCKIVKCKVLKTISTLHRSIAQLKWTLPCSTGVALLNGTELSILILNMLIDICSFYPSREEDGGTLALFMKEQYV